MRMLAQTRVQDHRLLIDERSGMMMRLLNISLLIVLLMLSGCSSPESQQSISLQPKPQEKSPGGAYVWHRDLGRIATTPAKPAPVQIEEPIPGIPGLVAVRESGVERISMTYPCPEYGVIQVTKMIPKEVELNKSFDYTIKVTNLTDVALRDIIINEELPPNFQYDYASPTPTKDDNKLIWKMDTLGPKANRQITVYGTATDTQGLRHCTTVAQLNRAYTDVEVVQPHLELRLTAPQEVLVCDPILLEYLVTNTGTGTARTVKIVQILPDGLKTAEGKAELIFDVDTLKAGQSRRFFAEVRAAKIGVFVNKAVAGSISGLRAESTATVTTVRQPKLVIDSFAPERQYLGRPVTNEITVTNHGDGLARDTIVENIIPEEVTSVEATAGAKLSGSKLVWKLGDVAPNESKTVRVSYIPAQVGQVLAVATATAYCAEDVSATAQTTVAGIPAVQLEVTDIEDPVEVGGQTTYIITATNQGTAPDTNIRIIGSLEDSLRYVSSAGATAGSVVGNTVSFSALRSLAPNSTATWRVVVRGVKAGDVRFRVVMHTDELVRPVEETEATHLYEQYSR